MKDNSLSKLISIKTNNDIVAILKSQKNKRINLSIGTIWLLNTTNTSKIFYALLVTKSSFKTAVIRNKIKRQLRNILIQSHLKGGIKILIKPNQTFLKNEYKINKDLINNSINRYQNGK